MTRSQRLWRRATGLALVGGSAFWVTNFAISRTPIAAQYRAALSIGYVPMLLEALAGGLIIGFCVGYLLLRFPGRIWGSDSILKSLTLSVMALVLVTVLLEVPAKFLTGTPEAMRWFLIGATFNGLRILALGLAIGAAHERLSP